MPDRLLRDELLDSERWINLKDNADRVAYIALLLRCDVFGNYVASEVRLIRLWRDYGINNSQLVAKTLDELAEQDLVRLYAVDNSPYLHIPRFRQRLRYTATRKFPPSPWDQGAALNPPGANQERTGMPPGVLQALTGRSPPKRSEEKYQSKPELPNLPKASARALAISALNEPDRRALAKGLIHINEAGEITRLLGDDKITNPPPAKR
jgi:hypothetical protein